MSPLRPFGLALLVGLAVVSLPETTDASTQHDQPPDSVSLDEAADEIESSLPPEVASTALTARFDPDQLRRVGDRLPEGDELVDQLPLDQWFDDRIEIQMRTEHWSWLVDVASAITELGALREADALYLSVTPQASGPAGAVTRYIEPIAPAQFPGAVHLRVTATGDNVEGSTLDRRLDELLPDDGLLVVDAPAARRVEATDSSAVADLIVPLRPDVDAEALLETIEFDEPDAETAPPTPALLDFARSDGPVAAYVDHRRVATLLATGALQPALPMFGAFYAETVNVRDPDFSTFWRIRTALAHRIHHTMAGPTAEFRDSSLRVDPDEAGGRVVSTRTDRGRRLARLLDERDLALPEHPDDAVWSLEFGAASDRAERHIGDSMGHLPSRLPDGLPSPPELLESLYPLQVLFNQPARATIPEAFDDLLPIPPLAARLTLHPAGALVDDRSDGDDEAVFVASALFDATPTNRLALEEFFGEEGALRGRATIFLAGSDILVERTGDEILVRHVFNADVDDAFETPTRTAPARLEHRIDLEATAALDFGPFSRRGRNRIQQALQLATELNPTDRRESHLEVVPRDNFSVLTFHTGQHQPGDAPDPVGVESLQSDPEPTCLAELRGRLQAGYLDDPLENLDDLDELARRCAGETDHNGPVVALGQTLWHAGFTAESEGRHRRALDAYRAACRRDVSPGCNAADRLAPLFEVRRPEALSDETYFRNRLPTRPSPTMATFDGETIGFSDNRLNHRDATPARLSQLVDDQSLPAPYSMIDATPRFRLFDANYDYRSGLVRRIELAAEPSADAREVLTPFAQIASSEDVLLHALLDPADDTNALPVSPLQPRTTEDVALDADQWREITDEDDVFHLGDDGITVIIHGERIAPLEECPADGPTICTDADNRRLLSRLDDGIDRLRDRETATDELDTRGSGVALVVDTQLPWQTLVRLGRLAGHPGHGWWRHTDETKSSRSRAVFDDVTVVVPPSR